VKVAIVLFDKVTALDALGPYAVLAFTPGTEISFVAEKVGPITDDNGALTMQATRSFDDFTDPDVVIVPGGFITRRMVVTGHPAIDWLKKVQPQSTWMASVCTGALLMASAGLLDGMRATTHWAAYEDLEALGAIPEHERVIVHRDKGIVTGAGVSAGIDMTLRLVMEMLDDQTAQRVQLGMEYDPQPPFDCGSPLKAPPEMVATMRAGMAESKRKLLADLNPVTS
jgi:transcriptional regulator GlxA family with amidase domain